jgi:hypothetical protein
LFDNPGSLRLFSRPGATGPSALKYPEITTCFVSLGKVFAFLDKIEFEWNTTDKNLYCKTATVADQRLEQTQFEVQNCHSVLHQFGLNASTPEN